MAAIIPSKITYNVSGSLRDQHYIISGATGDTLTVGLNIVKKVTTSPGTLITGVTITSIPSGKSTLTFASSAPMVNERIEVAGY